jgi:type II secretory pathway component GspD/PulD (secretin)
MNMTTRMNPMIATCAVVFGMIALPASQTVIAEETNNQPQIQIKARFLEVERNNDPASGPDWYLGGFPNGPVVANGRSAFPPATPSSAIPLGSFPSNTTAIQMTGPASNRLLTGILSSSNARITVQALQSKPGTKLLAKPECVTTSGRQTQMRAMVVQTVLTNINPLALKPPGVSSNELFLTERIECGPVFDVVPSVLADGYTLNLTATASVTEFLGYDKATNSVTVYIDGNKHTVPVPLPKFRTQKISAPVNLFDGQTLVLGGPVVSAVQTTKNKVPLLGDLHLGDLHPLGMLFLSQTEYPVKKKLMVFVTATIVDPAGNRVHSEDEIRQLQEKAKSDVPPQPQISSPSR